MQLDNQQLSTHFLPVLSPTAQYTEVDCGFFWNLCLLYLSLDLSLNKIFLIL